MHISFRFIFSLITLSCATNANATFSIIAIDKETKEFGSAFASCIELNKKESNSDSINKNLNSFIDNQLVVYVPGKGIMNLQGAVENVHLLNKKAKELINNDAKNAAEVINELIQYEKENQIATENLWDSRQFLALTFDPMENIAFKEVYTGKNTSNISKGMTKETPDGRFIYVMAGNILTGEDVINALSTGFEERTGNLSDKLIGALQNVRDLNNIGDSRCINKNGTTSNFAFIRTYKGNDTLKSYTTYANSSDQIDGIDSLISKYQVN
ncbi:DUF1028 domain-containing protein [Fluviispira sanaruensis]|uniref:DUF1028 domain-containing protein n=1 Tax=Fluviispira sanaruensis TaxID=2493639 RepID=A0A4P2VMM7_FLUSA|nr:DUF1028 domain-containing protein [Fluviispira sanaruensis]BBH53140.1 hypothetical protein JCM31447_15830 [Fluviispira sanaruensis]